jgi:hypothetical protein
MGKLSLLPTDTWPKDRFDGLAVTDTLSTPLPPTCTVRVELDALLENVIDPEVHPVVLGV